MTSNGCHSIEMNVLLLVCVSIHHIFLIRTIIRTKICEYIAAIRLFGHLATDSNSNDSNVRILRAFAVSHSWCIYCLQQILKQSLDFYFMVIVIDIAVYMKLMSRASIRTHSLQSDVQQTNTVVIHFHTKYPDAFWWYCQVFPPVHDVSASNAFIFEGRALVFIIVTV